MVAGQLLHPRSSLPCAVPTPQPRRISCRHLPDHAGEASVAPMGVHSVAGSSGREDRWDGLREDRWTSHTHTHYHPPPAPSLGGY